jgi:hypothetical protein
MRMLAYGIDSRENAEGLVSRIATSYPEYGQETATGVRWFRDGSGYHEIWACPVQEANVH